MTIVRRGEGGREGGREDKNSGATLTVFTFLLKLTMHFYSAVLDVSWAVNEVTISEDSGTVGFAVRKNGINERSVFVRAMTMSGSAEGE